MSKLTYDITIYFDLLVTMKKFIPKNKKRYLTDLSTVYNKYIEYKCKHITGVVTLPVIISTVALIISVHVTIHVLLLAVGVHHGLTIVVNWPSILVHCLAVHDKAHVCLWTLIWVIVSIIPTKKRLTDLLIHILQFIISCF